MDDNVFNMLKRKAIQYNIPIDVLYAVVMTESEGNPLAVGDNGKSHGLFQVYTTVHPDYNIAKGKSSIEYQADYWIPELKKAYDKAVNLGLKGVELALYTERYGERPKWTTTVENRVRKFYNQIKNTVKELILPVEGTISSNYGVDRGDHLHGGIDIASSYGSTVKSLFGGIVTGTGYSDSYGNYVSVKNPLSGMTEFFAHLSSISVQQGANILANTKIGGVGSTGRSTGNHLHYEIRNQDGKTVNPLEYLKQKTSQLFTETKSSITDILKGAYDIIADLGIYGMLLIIILISLLFIFKGEKTIINVASKGIDKIPVVGDIKDVIM